MARPDLGEAVEVTPWLVHGPSGRGMWSCPDDGWTRRDPRPGSSARAGGRWGRSASPPVPLFGTARQMVEQLASSLSPPRRYSMTESDDGDDVAAGELRDAGRTTLQGGGAWQGRPPGWRVCGTWSREESPRPRRHRTRFAVNLAVPAATRSAVRVPFTMLTRTHLLVARPGPNAGHAGASSQECRGRGGPDVTIR